MYFIGIGQAATEQPERKRASVRTAVGPLPEGRNRIDSATIFWYDLAVMPYPPRLIGG